MAKKSAQEKAMDYLAIRPLTERELAVKLASVKQYEADEIAAAVEFCRSRGYLNDALLASDAVQFLNSTGKGQRIIRRKLQTRGVDAELVEQALEALPPEAEKEAARNAAESKLRLLVREKDVRKKKEKLFRFLISRGFNCEIAGNLVREMVSGSSEDEEEFAEE